MSTANETLTQVKRARRPIPEFHVGARGKAGHAPNQYECRFATRGAYWQEGRWNRQVGRQGRQVR